MGEQSQQALDLWDTRPADQARDLAWTTTHTLYPDGTPVMWTAPWDTGGGMTKGESTPGCRCCRCGDVEINTFLLRLNHHCGAAIEHPRRRTEACGQLTCGCCKASGLAA